MIIWVIAGLLGLATGLRIGWALVNKQSLVSAAMIVALGSLGLVAALNWEPLTLLLDSNMRDVLIKSIDDLPEREKTVMGLYYEQDMNLREIGEVLVYSGELYPADRAQVEQFLFNR